MSRLCLNMIVRNESRILERCLRSVAPHVSTYAILDTGSTDGTPDLIRTFFRDLIPGVVAPGTFASFDQARNDALALARAHRSEVTYDYLLLTDADMELVVQDPHPLHATLTLPAHHVLQDNLTVAYDNVRLLRADQLAAARYVGLTHEYLDVPGAPRPTRIQGCHFLDHANGSSRTVKTVRDVRLLREELRRDPSNVRAMFYLAQTHKDQGDHERAIRYYRRRAAAGGYEEEAWYSEYMIAYCLMQQGKHDEAIAQALKAYERRPTRSEPLHLLAHHFRLQGKNNLSILMSETGRLISRPNLDELFVEEDVYEHGFDEEVSIAGYYSPRQDVRDVAYDACMRLAHDRQAPFDAQRVALANTVYYAESGRVAFGASYRTRTIARPRALEKGYVPMNPSVCAVPAGVPGAPDRIFTVVRWVNYRLGQASTKDVRTLNELAEFDPVTLDAIGARPFVDRALLGPCPVLPGAWVHGYEDLRLFRWRDRFWATATVRDRHPEGRAQICLLELVVERDRVVVSACRILEHEPGLHQKNWAPLVRGAELLLVYGADPTVVLRVDPVTFACEVVSRREPERLLESLRGSSQAIPFSLGAEDGYLYVVHEAFDRDDAPRRYLHRLVWLDAELAIRHVSDPFYFEHEGVEFCAGLARLGDDLLMSYGVEDRRPCVARVGVADATAWLLERSAPRSDAATEERRDRDGS